MATSKNWWFFTGDEAKMAQLDKTFVLPNILLFTTESSFFYI